MAEGGMGFVVAATHLHLDQLVALKFLKGDVGSEWNAIARFTREAKAAAQLRSEHIAHVLDAGQTEDGQPYMVMEYLEGFSLARALQSSGPLDVARAAEYLIQACEGLAEAHSRGIVHRDVKPYNLFLAERSPGWKIVKILDFGISKFAYSDAPHVVTGVIVGSPCYMSPEQLRSTAGVDHRTDIWSLGATLHELLTGKAAFDASQSLPELVAAILDRPAPPVHALRGDVPRELSAVVGRCLSKDRAARFASAGELAQALLPFAPRGAGAGVVAERAASMTPAFPLADSDADAGVASGMPMPAWGRAARLESDTLVAVGGDTSAAAAEHPADAAHPSPSDAPAALDVGRAEAPPSATTSASGRSRTLRWLGVSTLAAAAIVVAATILVAAPEPGGGGGAAGSNLPPSVAVPAVTRPLAPPAEVVTLAPEERPAPAMLQLVVRATPASARITVDGVSVADNPFRGSYPKDGERHHVSVRADGYEAKSQDIALDKDTILEISLAARPPARANAGRVAKRAAPAPAASSPPPPTPTQAPIATAVQVDSAGGRLPLRPIETKDPYGHP